MIFFVPPGNTQNFSTFTMSLCPSMSSNPSYQQMSKAQHQVGHLHPNILRIWPAFDQLKAAAINAGADRRAHGLDDFNGRRWNPWNRWNKLRLKKKTQARCSTQDQAIGNPQDLSVRVSVARFNAVYRLSIHEVMLPGAISPSHPKCGHFAKDRWLKFASTSALPLELPGHKWFSRCSKSSLQLLDSSKWQLQ
jgi:hypothetical protein